MKRIDVKSGSHAEYNNDSNTKDPTFKIGNHVRSSKYKNILAKGYFPNWFEEVSLISYIKSTVSWTHLLMILMVKKLLELSMKKKCRRLIKKNLE